MYDYGAFSHHEGKALQEGEVAEEVVGQPSSAAQERLSPVTLSIPQGSFTCVTRVLNTLYRYRGTLYCCSRIPFLDLDSIILAERIQ